MVRADFGSGLIRPRAQTCCASPTRTPARLANSPGFKSFRCPRWRIKFSLERFSDSYSHLFACPAVGKFSRASSAGGRRGLQSNFAQPDRVGRRGLSEPREDFSRLLTLANQILARTFSDPSRISLRAQPLESSLGRVPQAADVACNQTSLNQIVSVAEDCLSPERTFHGCLLMQFHGCINICIHEFISAQCVQS